MAERSPYYPERHTTIPPDRGGSRFGISAPPVIAPERPTTIPTLPHPEPAPQIAPEKPKKHTGRNIALATTGLGVLGGAYAAYETIPAVHERIDSFRNTFNPADGPRLVETKKVNPREAFDNGAKKTAIGPNKMYFIDLNNIDQFSLKSVINKEEQTIRFPFPFKMPANTTGTIERIDLADTDPNAQDPTQRPPIAPVDFKFKNVVSVMAPERSHMYLIKGIQDWGQDPNLAGQVRFYKYYEEADVTVVWWIFDNNPTKLGSFKNLLPMQDFKKETLRGTNWQDLPMVDALTEVMTTTEPNQPVQLNVMAYKGKIVGPEAEIAGNDFLLKPQFSTVSPNGTEKLLAFKKE